MLRECRIIWNRITWRHEKVDNVAKSGMSAVQLVLLTIANLANPISINDKTHGIRYKYTYYSFLPLYI